MTTPTDTIAPTRTARLAGLAYLYIIFAGIFAEVGVRAQLVDYEDPGATAANILASEQLYRTGFLAELMMTGADVLVALLFFRLFLVVDRHLSLAGLVFRLISASVAGVKAVAFFMPLVLLHPGAGLAGSFTPEQLNGLTVLFLKVHGRAYDISLFFFGIDCLIIGALIWRSGFLPKLLGLGLVIAGLCYLISSTIIFMWPAIATADAFMLFFLPCLVAEAGLTLWLILRGINAEGWKRAAQLS